MLSYDRQGGGGGVGGWGGWGGGGGMLTFVSSASLTLRKRHMGPEVSQRRVSKTIPKKGSR